MLGGGASSKKDDFLASARAARDQRSAERNRERRLVLAQAVARGWLARRASRKQALEEFDLRYLDN